MKGPETKWTTINDTMPSFNSYDDCKRQASKDIDGHQWKYDRGSANFITDPITGKNRRCNYVFQCKSHGIDCPAEVLYNQINILYLQLS